MRCVIPLALAWLAAWPAAADIVMSGSGSCSDQDPAVDTRVTAMAVTRTAADGPMDATRAAISSAAAAGLPVAWIIIEGTSRVDDAEPLLLIETEMRDLVAAEDADRPIGTATGDSPVSGLPRPRR